MNTKIIVILILLIGLVGVSTAQNMAQFTFVDNNTNQPIVNATIIATPDTSNTVKLLCWFYGRTGDICNPPDLPLSKGITNQNGVVDLTIYSGFIYNISVTRTNHFKIVTTEENYNYQIMV